MSQVDQFLQTPPRELVNELKELRTQKTLIEGKEDVIVGALEMLSRQGGQLADEIADLGASMAIGPLRQQIRQVMQTKQDEGEYFMVPLEIQRELERRGNRTVTLENCRLTMKRMAESNELIRPQPNGHLYALPNVFSIPGVEQAYHALLNGNGQ